METVEKREQLYEGKAKIIYQTENPDYVIIHYKDDATAFNGAKKESIPGKGELNAKISSVFFELLHSKGIPTHFVRQLNDHELLVRKLEIIPVEVVIRNIAAGSLVRRLGLKEGTKLPFVIREFYYKDDALGDPLVNEYHLQAMGVATFEQLSELSRQALEINRVLREFLRQHQLDLVDFKLEFGIFNGQILLGDEISPDTCRFWDTETHEKLDKDRFREDLGGLTEAYSEVYRRIIG
ncbi:MAG: phosphoribosylaminoimidazolesuccinocarboxamide synthase [Firmicutes bacterium]|nr:phosphoribosylaminoimidazolesuccinocarboxamide synthase [Bacillota bacterium]